MSEHDRFDDTILDWLADASPVDVPSRVVDAATAEARHTLRVSPLPDFITRWLPMSTNFAAALPVPLARPQPVRRLRSAAVMIALALLTLALIGAALLSVGVSPSPAVTVHNGRIAFVTGGNDIYTVAPDGTDRRLLVDSDGYVGGELAGVAWSPDGTRLAFWTTGSPTRDPELMVVDADGSDPTVVASGDDTIGLMSVWGPVWSPDGSRLAFTARTVGGPQTACVDSNDEEAQCTMRVFVVEVEVDADGANGPVQVGDPDMSARTAAWSPDGSTIAFTSGDSQQGGMGLYVMDADGTYVRRIDRVRGTGWSFRTLAWSPDGKTIAATAGMESGDIWEFAVDGSTARMVSDTLEVATDQLGPSYAPDGALAWESGAAIALLEAGGLPQKLAGFGGADWSPDGLYILTTDNSTSGQIVIIDRGGTIVARIEAPPHAVSWQRLTG